MRVIVVGAGVIGLLAALECLRTGARVTLLDRGGIPDPRAGSSDHHRVVRALHRGDQAATTAGVAAHLSWTSLDHSLGTGLYRPVGALSAMAPEQVEGALDLLHAAGAPATRLRTGELQRAHPTVAFPAGLEAVVEPRAGVVLADRALAALVGRLSSEPGVELLAQHEVISLDGAGGLELDDGSVLTADAVIVAPGAWARKLLPAVIAAELTLLRQSTLVYAPADRQAWARMPAVPALGTAEGAWLMPPVADTPVKLSAHSACRPVAEVGDTRTPQVWREHLISLFADLITGFDPAAVTAARDGYYLAAGPQLALLGDGRTQVLAACGGAAFKFAPLIARAMAARAVGGELFRTGLQAVDHPLQVTGATRGCR